MKYYLYDDRATGKIKLAATDQDGGCVFEKQSQGLQINISNLSITDSYLEREKFREIDEESFTQIYYEMCYVVMPFAITLDQIISLEINKRGYKLHHSNG